MDLPDVEKEVKRLLRADQEAIKVEWEVVAEDEEKKLETKENAPSNVDSKYFLYLAVKMHKQYWTFSPNATYILINLLREIFRIWEKKCELYLFLIS